MTLYNRKKRFIPRRYMWSENGILRQRQDWLFEITFQEFREFVLANNCFPTASNDSLTMRGTSLTLWRTAIKSKGPQKHRQRLLEFERDQGKRFAEQKRYMGVVGDDWEEGCPDTLEEYLYGANRFIYFNPSTYMRIIKEYDLDATLCPYITFFLKILSYSSGIPWVEFHQRIDMNRVIDVKHLQENILKLLSTLNDRQRDVIIHRYGLFDHEPLTCEKVGVILSITGSRIAQIENNVLRKLRGFSRFREWSSYFGNASDNCNKNIIPTKGHHFFVFYFDCGCDPQIIRGRVDMLEEAISNAGFGYCVIKSVKTFYGDVSYYGRCLLREFTNNHMEPVNYTIVELYKESDARNPRDIAKLCSWF